MTVPLSASPGEGTSDPTAPTTSRLAATQAAVGAQDPRGEERTSTSRGDDRLSASLRRLAALHGDLASEYEILAEEVGIHLAGCAESSLHGVMPANPPTPLADPTLVTPGELATLLQCCPRTVRRMELGGELPPSIKEGRLKRWRRAEIEAWLDSRGGVR